MLSVYIPAADIPLDDSVRVASFTFPPDSPTLQFPRIPDSEGRKGSLPGIHGRLQHSDTPE